MYECGKMDILVANPLDEDADFQIILKNIVKPKIEETNKTRNKKKFMKRKAKARSKKEPPNLNFESSLPMFFVKQETIRIKKKSVEKLAIFYQPLTFEPHLAQISMSTFHRLSFKKSNKESL